MLVVAKDLNFSADEVRIPADRANLTLRNDGTTEHDLTIQEFGVHLVAAPGQSVSTGLRDPRKGRYSAVCTNTRPRNAGDRRGRVRTLAVQ